MAQTPDPPDPDTRKNPAHRFPWPLTVVILLLLGQFAIYAWLNYLNILDFSLIDPQSLTPEEAATLILDVIVLIVVFAFFDIVILIAIASTLRRARAAWANALFVQALTLGLSLLLYFGGDRSWLTYGLMAYGLAVVVYLLVPGVQGAFLPPGRRTEAVSN